MRTVLLLFKHTLHMSSVQMRQVWNDIYYVIHVAT